MIAALTFYMFAGVAVVSGVMVVSARNPMHSVLFLILAFFNAAGLFVLMGAEFLAMILVVVYVGAVAVLFMFVVMMLDINFAELRQGFRQYLLIGATIGVVLLVELLFIMGGWTMAPGAFSIVANAGNGPGEQYRGIGRVDLHPLYLPVPGCGHGSSGRHDRGNRINPSITADSASPEYRQSDPSQR